MDDTLARVEVFVEQYVHFWANKLRQFGLYPSFRYFIMPLESTPHIEECLNENGWRFYSFFSFPTPILYEGVYRLWYVHLLGTSVITKEKARFAVNKVLGEIKNELKKEGYEFVPSEYVNSETVYLVGEIVPPSIRTRVGKTRVFAIKSSNAPFRLFENLSKAIELVISRLDEKMKFKSDEQQELILLNLEFSKLLERKSREFRSKRVIEIGESG